MSVQVIIDRAVQSIKAPREAARWLVDQNFGNDVLAMGFALVLVLNVLLISLFQAFLVLNPVVAPLISQPLFYMGGLGLMLAAIVVALSSAGRSLGGTGTIRAVAALVVWLQLLRIAAQIIVFVLALISPAIATLISFVFSIAGLWIALNFIAEAHGFAGIGKAALTMALGLVGVAIASVLVLSVLGISTTGMVGNV